MTDRVFRLLELFQGFIIDRNVVAPKKSERFEVIKFTGKIRRVRANIYSTINVSIENSYFLLRRMIGKTMKKERDWERYSEESLRTGQCF